MGCVREREKRKSKDALESIVFVNYQFLSG